MASTLSLLIMKMYLPLEQKCIVWMHESSLPTSTLQSPFISQELMFKMEVSSHESFCCKQLFSPEIFKKNQNKAHRQIKMTSSKQKHLKLTERKKYFSLTNSNLMKKKILTITVLLHTEMPESTFLIVLYEWCQETALSIILNRKHIKCIYFKNQMQVSRTLI